MFQDVQRGPAAGAPRGGGPVQILGGTAAAGAKPLRLAGVGVGGRQADRVLPDVEGFGWCGAESVGVREEFTGAQGRVRGEAVQRVGLDAGQRLLGCGGRFGQRRQGGQGVAGRA